MTSHPSHPLDPPLRLLRGRDSGLNAIFLVEFVVLHTVTVNSTVYLVQLFAKLYTSVRRASSAGSQHDAARC